MASFDPRKNRKPPGKPSSPLWMTTYGDMVTLLLTFFVLLFSFTSMDKNKFEQVAGSLRGALGVVQQNLPFQGAAPGSIGGTDYDLLRRSEIFESVESLRDALNEFTKDGSINIEATESGILIQMGDRILFDQGQAELKPKALEILTIVGETIRDQASDILVAGHTDNVPIHNKDFPSNWELSTARALSVVRFLVDTVRVPPRILGAVGYGEYRPVAPNLTAAQRQINRRVEFLVTWK
ncbi:MAG: flagellar motor protein MotB [FCB group bacterium]|nr:flagellar motor protein MotB [FCB group bacterium]